MTKQATPKATFKAFVSATGDALKASGHPMSHSALLEAMSAAMGTRGWNHFCADLGMAVPLAVQTPVVAMPSETATYYPTPWQIYAARMAATLSSKPVATPVARTYEAIYAMRDAFLKCGINVVLRSTAGSKEHFEVRAKWNIVTNTLSLVNSVVLPSERVVMRCEDVSDSFECPLQVKVGLDGVLVIDEITTGNLMVYCDGFLVDEITAFGLPYGVGPYVEGVLKSDDSNAKAIFDARPYLATASDKQLEAIWNVGLSGDYCTDDISERVHELLPNDAIASVYSYVDAVHAHNDVGHETSLDSKMFVAWVREQRPGLHARLICEQEGVVLSEENGKHGYQIQEHIAVGFASQDEAALAAVKVLDVELETY